MIGIFAEEHSEIVNLINKVKLVKMTSIAQTTVYDVTINNKPLVIVTTGAGKVNVASAISYTISTRKLTALIGIGNCGVINPAKAETTIPINTIAISTSALQYDIDFVPLGHNKFTLPSVAVSTFNADNKLVHNAIQASEKLGYAYNLGLFGSADTFLASTTFSQQLTADYNIRFIDVECGASAQLGYLTSFPFVFVKGVSNFANDDAVKDYNTNQNVANGLACDVVYEMIIEMEQNCETPVYNTRSNTYLINCCY